MHTVPNSYHMTNLLHGPPEPGSGFSVQQPPPPSDALPKPLLPPLPGPGQGVRQQRPSHQQLVRQIYRGHVCQDENVLHMYSEAFLSLMIYPWTRIRVAHLTSFWDKNSQ